MKIPLHISPEDQSEGADLARIQHHQQMFAVTGGKGFRQPGKKATRIERIAARHFSE